MPAKKKPQQNTSKTKPKARKAANHTLKLSGHIIWFFVEPNGECDGTRYEVQSAILREDKELAIDCNCAEPGDSPYVYTILLHRQDSLLFRGHWSAGKAAERSTGMCVCRLYRHGDRIALFGVWKEDGATQEWCGEFTAST